MQKKVWLLKAGCAANCAKRQAVADKTAMVKESSHFSKIH
jgi:hypothetical protein